MWERVINLGHFKKSDATNFCLQQQDSHKVNNKDVQVLKSPTGLLIDSLHCPGCKVNT